jgi:hypothetical protein
LSKLCMMKMAHKVTGQRRPYIHSIIASALI